VLTTERRGAAPHAASQHADSNRVRAHGGPNTPRIIKTGHRLSGKEVQIPSSKVDRISWDESTVLVNSTKEAILQAPACDDA
jgi:hypothetical protein